MNGIELRHTRESLALSQARLAEHTGISQHLLSAFELGKSSLDPRHVAAISSFLEDEEKVAQLVGRKKRYRNHEYAPAHTDHERACLCSRTEGNHEYVHLLNELERRRRQNPCSLSALSLFSGCGGFSLGFSWAGFAVKGFVEINEGLRRIYRENFPSALQCGTDITKVSADDLARISEEVGKIDVMIGGPPCQGFSLAGKRDVKDPRNALFRHYLRFVDHFRPKVAVVENVRLLTSMKNQNGGLVRDDILQAFGEHGYTVRFFEINAKDYGVPQHRERVLFVAVSNDLSITPSLPPLSHGDSSDLFQTTPKYRSFADACSDLEYLESGQVSEHDVHHVAVAHPVHVIEWLWNVPQGCSAHDNADPKLRPPSGYNTTYKRQVWNEPAGTVQTTFGMISGCRNVHPVATRALTVREAARIQSFPDTFRFSGTAGTIRTGIGNAVPPLLAFAVGQHIANQLANLVEIPRL